MEFIMRKNFFLNLLLSFTLACSLVPVASVDASAQCNPQINRC
jgi:hypothetical protein